MMAILENEYPFSLAVIFRKLITLGIFPFCFGHSKLIYYSYVIAYILHNM